MKTQLEVSRATAFKSLYGVSTQKEILELFKQDCIEHKSIKNDDEAKEESASKLFSKYALAITFLYSLSQIKNNLKNYKKIISELRLGSVVTQKFYFEGLSMTVNKTTKAKREVREETGKKMPFNLTEEILRVEKILKTNSFNVAKNQTINMVRSYHIVYILGLATGRRFTEIMKTVSVVKRGNKYFFKGLLKKRDEVKNKLVPAYFLGLSYTAINAYLKELRKYIDKKLQEDKNLRLEDVTENQISTIFGRVYNNAVVRISGKKVPNVHELRHFYTIEHQEQYIRNNPHLRDLNQSDLEVVLKNVRYTVLAHELGIDTTATYVTIK